MSKLYTDSSGEGSWTGIKKGIQKALEEHMVPKEDSDMTSEQVAHTITHEVLRRLGYSDWHGQF